MRLRAGCLAAAIVAAQALPGHAQSQVPSPLGLQDAVALALSQNPDVKTARLELAESRARKGEARAPAWPQLRWATAMGQSNNFTSVLGSGGTGTSEDLSSVLSSTQSQFATVRLLGSMTLWDWGRTGSAVAVADQEEFVAFEKLRATRQDVAYKVRSAYLALVSARSASRLAAQAAARAEAHFVATDRRRLRGVETELAVLRSEAKALGLQQEAGKAARTEREAEAELALLLGAEPHRTLDVVPFDGGAAAMPSEADARKRALEARPDLRIADAQVKEEKARLDAEGRSQLPSLFLSASGGAVASTQLSSIIPDVSVTGTLAGPLFDGFRSAGSLERAELAVERIRQSRDRLAARVAVEVETARNAVLEAIDRQRLADREQQVAVKALAAEKSRQQGGSATLLDVLDAELAAYQAEQRANQALYDRSLAETRLARAMGEDPQEARLEDLPVGWKVP